IFADDAYVAAPVALETFLSNYVASLLDPMDTIEPEAAAPQPASGLADRFSAFDAGTPFESLTAIDLSERPIAAFEPAPRPVEKPFDSPGRLAPLGSGDRDLARGGPF